MFFLCVAHVKFHLQLVNVLGSITVLLKKTMKWYKFIKIYCLLCYMLVWKRELCMLETEACSLRVHSLLANVKVSRSSWFERTLGALTKHGQESWIC